VDIQTHVHGMYDGL